MLSTPFYTSHFSKVVTVKTKEIMMYGYPFESNYEY